MTVAESLESTFTPGNLRPLGAAVAAPSQSPLPAKVVSLRTRPFFASHLCFETGGILGDLNLTLNPSVGLLGATVPGFNFDLFYSILGSRPTVPAAGFITFTTNPAAGTAIVLNGTTWTFVSTLTTGNQLLLGSTLDLTLTSAVKTLQASTDANTRDFTYAAFPTALILTAAAGGSGGNALTISTTVPGATASGSTLSGGDSSRLLYDFPKIQADVAPFTLATLRAQPTKAALDKAINARQNAYFAKYAHQDSIISFAEQYYLNPPDLGLGGPTNPYSKLSRLDSLSDTNESRWTSLNGAYSNAGRADGDAGVVSEVKTGSSSGVIGYGYAENSSVDQTIIVAPSTAPDKAPADPLSGITPNTPPDPAPAPYDTADSPWRLWDKTDPGWDPSSAAAGPVEPGSPDSGTTTVSQFLQNNSPVWPLAIEGVTGTFTTAQQTSSYQTNSTQNQALQAQNGTIDSQEFRHPFYDAKAQYQRAQISLIDQKYSALLSAQNIPNLATVFTNELASIDADVYQLQIAYLNTILMSPIGGVVTGVYKNPGDPVSAGEPVIRVEYFDVILIEAIVIFRGPVLVNQTTVTITTALFGSSSGQPTSISGLVVSARIHDADDTWHLVVECANTDGSTPPKPIFPPGYRFDPDDTTVTIG